MRNNLRHIIAIFVGTLLFTGSLFASNPHHKNTISKENYVKATEIGVRYTKTYEQESENALILFSEINSPFTILKSNDNHPLRINFELNSAHMGFHSWVLFQGLVAYELVQEVGDLSFLAEWDLIIWTESMRYLEQAIFEVNSEVDYSNHPRFDFARRHKLYMVDFYRAWQQGDAVLETKLAERKRSLGGKWLTIEEFLEMDPTDRLKRKALKLKKFWDDIR